MKKTISRHGARDNARSLFSFFVIGLFSLLFSIAAQATPVITAQLDTDANTLSIHVDNFLSGESPLKGIFENLGIPGSEVLNYTTNGNNSVYIDNSSYSQLAYWSEGSNLKDYIDISIKYSDLANESAIPSTNTAHIITFTPNIGGKLYKNLSYDIQRVDSGNNNQIPEPPVLGLMLIGLFGIAWIRKRNGHSICQWAA